MAQIKDLYVKYGESTRALDFGKTEYKVPSKINKKVQFFMGWMLANGKMGDCLPLEKVMARVVAHWKGKGVFTTADMFSPSDLVQALRLYYARVSLGEIRFSGKPLMAEVIENKSTRQLVLTFRQFIPDLIKIVSADSPKTSKEADEALEKVLDEADLPETELSELDRVIAGIKGLSNVNDPAIKKILDHALKNLNLLSVKQVKAA